MVEVVRYWSSFIHQQLVEKLNTQYCQKRFSFELPSVTVAYPTITCSRTKSLWQLCYRLKLKDVIHVGPTRNRSLCSLCSRLVYLWQLCDFAYRPYVLILLNQQWFVNKESDLLRCKKRDTLRILQTYILDCIYCFGFRFLCVFTFVTFLCFTVSLTLLLVGD